MWTLRETLEKLIVFHSASMGDRTREINRESLNSIETFMRKRKKLLIHTIELQDIAEWMDWEKQRGLSGVWITRKLNLINRLMFFALDEKQIAVNPVNYRRLPRLDCTPPTKVPFTYEQYLKVQAVVSDTKRFQYYWPQMFTLAWHSGLRCIDVCTMMKGAVSFKDNTVSVRPKKLESARQKLVIPMEQPLREMMETIFVQNRFPNSPYLMPGAAVLRTCYRGNLVVEMRRICDEAGLPDHSFHSFRHGFVTRLLNAGVDPITIQSLTGQTLEQIRDYAHISVDAKTNALAKSRQAFEMLAKQQQQVTQL